MYHQEHCGTAGMAVSRRFGQDYGPNNVGKNDHYPNVVLGSGYANGGMSSNASMSSYPYMMDGGLVHGNRDAAPLPPTPKTVYSNVYNAHTTDMCAFNSNKVTNTCGHNSVAAEQVMDHVPYTGSGDCDCQGNIGAYSVIKVLGNKLNSLMSDAMTGPIYGSSNPSSPLPLGGIYGSNNPTTPPLGSIYGSFTSEWDDEDDVTTPNTNGVCSNMESTYLLTSMTHQYIPYKTRTLSPFRSSSDPNVPIISYLQRLREQSCCSNVCFIMVYVYIVRILNNLDEPYTHCTPMTTRFHSPMHVRSMSPSSGTNNPISVLTIHRLVLACLVVASKHTDDVYYNNLFYAKIGGISLLEMNKLEIEVMSLLQCHLNIKEEELWACWNAMCSEFTMSIATTGMTGNNYSPSSNRIMHHHAPNANADLLNNVFFHSNSNLFHHSHPPSASILRMKSPNSVMRRCVSYCDLESQCIHGGSYISNDSNVYGSYQASGNVTTSMDTRGGNNGDVELQLDTDCCDMSSVMVGSDVQQQHIVNRLVQSNNQMLEPCNGNQRINQHIASQIQVQSHVQYQEQGVYTHATRYQPQCHYLHPTGQPMRSHLQNHNNIPPNNMPIAHVSFDQVGRHYGDGGYATHFGNPSNCSYHTPHDHGNVYRCHTSSSAGTGGTNNAVHMNNLECYPPPISIPYIAQY